MAVTELIKSQEDLLKDLGIKQIKPSDPEEDKTLPLLFRENCTKSIELILKKFDLSKDERDLELEKIKVETQGKIESLKDENQLKVLLSENDKLLSSDFKKLTKKLMRSQIINDGKRVDGRDLDEVRKFQHLLESFQKGCMALHYSKRINPSFIYNHIGHAK